MPGCRVCGKELKVGYGQDPYCFDGCVQITPDQHRIAELEAQLAAVSKELEQADAALIAYATAWDYIDLGNVHARLAAEARQDQRQFGQDGVGG